MDPIDELAAELRQSIGRLVRAARREGDSLPPAHSATLGFLGREGPMTIAELARRRGVKHQGQSRTVGELTNQEYVERTASETDRRASVIRITDAGGRRCSRTWTAVRTGSRPRCVRSSTTTSAPCWPGCRTSSSAWHAGRTDGPVRLPAHLYNSVVQLVACS